MTDDFVVVILVSDVVAGCSLCIISRPYLQRLCVLNCLFGDDLQDLGGLVISKPATPSCAILSHHPLMALSSPQVVAMEIGQTRVHIPVSQAMFSIPLELQQ